jgi:hypothetical protein
MAAILVGPLITVARKWRGPDAARQGRREPEKQRYSGD